MSSGGYRVKKVYRLGIEDRKVVKRLFKRLFVTGLPFSFE